MLALNVQVLDLGADGGAPHGDGLQPAAGGFAGHWHHLLSGKAALPYALDYCIYGSDCYACFGSRLEHLAVKDTPVNNIHTTTLCYGLSVAPPKICAATIWQMGCVKDFLMSHCTTVHASARCC